MVSELCLVHMVVFKESGGWIGRRRLLSFLMAWGSRDGLPEVPVFLPRIPGLSEMGTARGSPGGSRPSGHRPFPGELGREHRLWLGRSVEVVEPSREGSRFSPICVHPRAWHVVCEDRETPCDGRHLRLRPSTPSVDSFGGSSSLLFLVLGVNKHLFPQPLSLTRVASHYETLS